MVGLLLPGLAPAAADGAEVTIFPSTATPATASVADRTAHELGVKFRASSDGRVTGVRFFKGTGNTGTHVGTLWSRTGTRLASATFTGETSSGWQTVRFATPVAVTAGQTYVASYSAPNGGFALTQRFFTGTSAGSSGVTALASGTDGGNGVYKYGGTGFPTSSYADANYWVDVLFSGTTTTTEPATEPTTAPTPAPTTEPTAPTTAPTTGASTSAYGPQPSSETCTGTTVPAGADVQAAISAAASGATLCLQPGTYRLSSALSPKSGQTLWGAPGTVLTGSRLMTNWARSGAAWVATGHLPAPYTDSGYNPCQDTTTNLCKLNEWAFRDDVPLRRVASLSAVVPGTFYTDYSANAVYVGDDPAGHRLELSRTKTAISSGAQNVTLRGLTVEKFATANQRGAIVVNGTGWLLRDNVVRFNHGAGIYVYASGATIRHNRVHHNGTLGIAAYKVASLLVERNELDHNNTDGSWVNDGENGGYKSTNSTDTVIDNWAHDNNGLGLWFDIDNRGTRVENNLVTDNASDGIRFEISYDGLIRGNTVTGNGHNRQHGDGGIGYGASIVVSTSSRVKVLGNTVSGDNGIGLIAANRGAGAYGTYVLSDVEVSGNTVTMARGRTGLVATNGDSSVFTSRGNTFRGNTYRLPDGTWDRTWFQWQGAARTPTQWLAAGNDSDGTFLLQK